MQCGVTACYVCQAIWRNIVVCHSLQHHSKLSDHFYILLCHVIYRDLSCSIVGFCVADVYVHVNATMYAHVF